MSAIIFLVIRRYPVLSPNRKQTDTDTNAYITNIQAKNPTMKKEAMQ